MTTDQTIRLGIRLLPACAVPGLALLIGICLINGGYPGWPAHGPDLETSAAAGLTVEASLLVMLAAVVGATHTDTRTARHIGNFVVLLLASSAIFGSVLGGPGLPERILASHMVMLSASAAAFACGLLASAFWSNSLDAAGAAMIATLSASGGALWIGANTSTVSTTVSNGLLALSPAVSVAAAINFDVLHTAALYQLSPLAHQQYAYQPWWESSATYAVTALALWCAAVVRRHV